MFALSLSLVLTVFLNIVKIHSIIVNGTIADIKEAPYQVQVIMFEKFFCGGSIVGTRQVVSAAHCFDRKKVNELFRFDMRINAGSAFTLAGDEYLVEQTFIHPEYNPTVQDYDVSVIVIKGQFNAANNQIPIALAIDSNINALGGQMAMVTGFGKVSDQGLGSPRMLKLHVPIWTVAACVISYEEITPRRFCAGFELGGSDVYYGDSGGPLVLNGLLIGIVSSGRKCAEPFSPGVYTNVALVRNWIDSLIYRTIESL